MYTHNLFNHYSGDGHLGCFHLLVLMNNAAINIYVQVFVLMYILNSLGYIPRSKIAGTCDNSIFNISRN